ncbi:NUDIX hydrolase [Cyanobium sp. Aljojuca 7D2]|nr:NUDIX hydrolase [Cyanobium sp. Aljojuca 7D2]
MKAALKRLLARLRLVWLAAVLYEGWRRLVRPHTHGALVAIWCGEQLLLVETSYRRSWGLPGGGIGRGETARQAAVRELAEELGLRVAPEQLRDPWTITERTAGGLNTVTIFALHAGERPAVAVDGLEIVACHWLGRQEALAQVLPSHVRQYLLTAGQAIGQAGGVGAAE